MGSSPEATVPAYRRLRMPRKRPQVLGADLNRSESRRRAMGFGVRIGKASRQSRHSRGCKTRQGGSEGKCKAVCSQRPPHHRGDRAKRHNEPQRTFRHPCGQCGRAEGRPKKCQPLSMVTLIMSKFSFGWGGEQAGQTWNGPMKGPRLNAARRASIKARRQQPPWSCQGVSGSRR